MTSAANPKSLLMNASVLVYLFRALAGTRTAHHRDAVGRQIVQLIREWVDCTDAVVALGRSDDEIFAHLQRHANSVPVFAANIETIWRSVLREGAWTSESSGLAVIPIYASASLAGVILLASATLCAEHLVILSAVASLASVAVESVREIERLRQGYEQLEERHLATGGILGRSPAIRKLLQRVERLAPRDTTVLIQGESGTGKELVARSLHRQSPRAEAPFVAINCAAITETLLESELFGHEKGSFTGAATLKKGKIEVAEGGTLFLDEIAELAPALQAKLLRVLQQREFERIGGTRTIRIDVRLLAATNRDLAHMVRCGGFREDLFHRLNVVALRTPPLRERKEDIASLAAHFVHHYSAQCDGKKVDLSPEALQCLETYDWPGNVRELQNAMEYAVVLGESGTILPSDLPEHLWQNAAAPAFGSYQMTVTDAKRESILKAYASAGGDYRGAAALLGLHPNYLLRLVRNLGLKDAIRKGSYHP
jgi:Nif-specific regulatory protein